MKRYLRVLVVAVAVLALEIIGGIYSGSLALLADAGHVLADNTAIVVSIVVATVVRFGFLQESRVRKIGFWINIALLAFVVVLILHEAIERIREPREVMPVAVIGIAALGALGNWLQHRIMAHVDHGDRHETHRVLSAHILSDLALSIGVVAGGILMAIFEEPLLDPVISIAIAGWIGKMTLDLTHDQNGGTHRH